MVRDACAKSVREGVPYVTRSSPIVVQPESSYRAGCRWSGGDPAESRSSGARRGPRRHHECDGHAPGFGAWLVMTPLPPSPVTFAADGLITLGNPVNYVYPALGVTFQTAALGVWKPTGERTIRFTAVQ